MLMRRTTATGSLMQPDGVGACRAEQDHVETVWSCDPRLRRGPRELSTWIGQILDDTDRCS